MLIDEFLPAYDIAERHQILIDASLQDVYAAARILDLSHARLTRWLFRLRGIPATRKFTLENFQRMRFVLLGEHRDQEMVLGLVGQFWKPSGRLRRVDVEGFCNFREAGYAKAVWNFHLTQEGPHRVRLTTETRIHCLDEASRRSFRLYWHLIGRFSALIRREVLQSIKKEAEDTRERQRVA